MRSIKLVPPLAATAMLLALTPAAASARPQDARNLNSRRPCRVHIEVPKAPITDGEPLTIFGTLSCPKAEQAAGKQVLLYQQSAGKGAITLVGSATTETGGAFQITPPLLTTNSLFYALSEGAKSARRAVKVAPQVTSTPPTPAEGTQLFTGGGRAHRAQNKVTFAGKVSPSDAGARVALQRENATANEEWRRIDLGSVNSTGEYSITHTFAVPGDANIRVVVHPPKGLNVPAATTPLSYEISQAENPQLTIKSSADPLSYGQPVAITGVVAGAAANTPLTLLARSRGAAAFVPVATGKTGNGGAYEFAQTPLTNTSYEVSDATTKSAVLFEGVKYGLVVSPPPTTAATGQALSFSGTVVPALTGHVVYLERQSSLRIGWNVVDVGVVAAPPGPSSPAPFSIVHAFYGAGTDRLRIKIPGDPQNQGIASPAFELNVVRTQASVLRPEAPGNSKLPGEGQL